MAGGTKTLVNGNGNGTQDACLQNCWPIIHFHMPVPTNLAIYKHTIQTISDVTTTFENALFRMR